MSNKMYYYVTGNTAKGLVNYLPSNLTNIKHVIILNHKSKAIKTRIIKSMLLYYKAKHNNIEVICSPLGKDFLEGIIIRELSIAVITNTIAGGDYSNPTKIDIQTFIGNIEVNNQQLIPNIDNLMDKAYEKLRKGLEVHDHLEQVYINEMDFNKADKLANELIHNILTSVSMRNKNSHINHRLFGTTTGVGVINIVPELIEPIKNRYYIKGRAGTGKSFFMNQVAEACKDYGLDLDLYHCSFDPESIDMVLIPEIDTCLFDSTDPHEFFPTRHDDVVIDLYDKTVTKGTDQKYAADINRISKEYKAHVKKGQYYIQKASVLELQLEQEYMKSIDESKIEKIIHYIYEKIN